MRELLKYAAYGALWGLGLKVFLDILFYIMYSTYNVAPGVLHYYPAILLGALVSALFHFLMPRSDEVQWSRTWLFVAFTLIIVMPIRWILAGINSTDYLNPELSLFVIRGFVNYNHEWIIAFVIIIFAIIGHLVLLYRQQQDKVKYSLAAIESYKKEQAEYRFGMLQAQIDPHFLFNSLNTLASLVHTDAEAASQFVRRLSSVYRNVLHRSREDLHALSEELSLLEDYCALISIRFKDRVRFEMDIDEGKNKMKIPPLTLQLLIENAVKHNVASADSPLIVRIYTDSDDYIHVANLLKPKRIQSDSSGTGLENIVNRFKSFTKKSVVIQDKGPEFIVSIPLIK